MIHVSKDRAPDSLDPVHPVDAYQKRHGIYGRPPAERALTQAAQAWLGGSAFDAGASDAAIRLEDDAQPVVGEPGRHRFHASLKAPIPLAPGRHIDELEEALSVRGVVADGAAPDRADQQLLVLMAARP